MPLLRAALAAAVATVAAAAASLGADGVDDSSLLQVATSLDQHRASANNCNCLTWKDVYKSHGVVCGMGQELLEFGGMVMKPVVGEEFCTKFYEKLSGNFCTQLHYSTDRKEQWCYVSSQCQALNGGAPLSGTSVSWKQCTAQEDRMLLEMAPSEVLKLAQAEDKDAGLMIKMAYPLYTAGIKWPDVQATLLGHNGQVDPTTKSILEGIQANSTPTIFDSSDGHPPFGVIAGNQIYEVHFSDWFWAMSMAKKDIWTAPGKINTYQCVSGCAA